MDENVYDEIFEGWLRTPDLTIEMPWMLRNSLENFQEMRLVEDEKGREGRAHTPFEPARKPCSLQDLPSRTEELEFGSDTISIPPECSIDNQNSPLSSPISDRKSTRSESATWELPVPAVLPLPCHAYPETERGKPGQDLPAELEKLQSGSADAIISRQDSRYNGRQLWISTPSLGVMLESARSASCAPSSFHPHSFLEYSDLTKSDLTIDGDLGEKVIKPDVPTFRLQKLPSLCLHKSISNPSLGVRLRATRALSYPRSPSLETLPPRNVQEKSPHCINANISSSETKDSSSHDIRGCASEKDDIPETPGINVMEPSNASETASFHEQVSRDETTLELPILPAKCDETATKAAIDESAGQSGTRDESSSSRHEELAREDYQERSTETEPGLSAVHVGQPAQNNPPCTPILIHETNASPASVDVVHDPSKDLSNRRPKKILRRVPVAPGGQSEKVVVNNSRVKMSSPSNSPIGARCVDSGATQTQTPAGKSDGVTWGRPQSSHEVLPGPNTAKTSLGVDIDSGAGRAGGSGTRTGNGTGAGAGTTTAVALSAGHHRSEVGASRADTDPASPRPNRNHPDRRGHWRRNRNWNRPGSQPQSGQGGLRDSPRDSPRDSGGVQPQPSSRNYHGPSKQNSVAPNPPSPPPPLASPPTSSAPHRQSQSLQSNPVALTEVARLEPHSHPRPVSLAESTTAPVTSESAPIMSVDTSSPAHPGAAAALTATNLNAQASGLAPYGRRVPNGKLCVNNLALAIASYDAASHATSPRPAGVWRTKPAPYAAHDDDMIKPVGNWDSSADDAAHTPVPGESRSRIDLRKVREITKLTERLRPRVQAAQQGLVRVVPVQMAGVPVNGRNPNGANGSKSPPPSPAKAAVAKPQDVAPPCQTTTECLELVKPSVPPHLRQAIVPVTPKLLLKKKLPASASASKPTASTNGNFDNSDIDIAKQADVPAVEHATAKVNPVDNGATHPSTQSRPKTPSDRSLPESAARPSPSPTAEKITMVVTFAESNTPPAASSDHFAKTDGVPSKAINKKVPNKEFRHPLMGWDGTWQEAPVDWSGRPSFNTQNRDRLSSMNTWMEERAQEALNNPVTVDTRAPGFETGEALAVGEKELHKPINRRIHDTHLPDDDFTHAKKDGTAAEALEKHQARVRVVERDARAAERESKADRRAYREAVREAAAKYIPPPNPHTPRANIYLRPAILEDMVKITELYNHYITHSVVASERTAMTAHQWQTRWEDAREAKYAFLVAVQSSPRGGGYSRRTSEEVLTGFAYADDYGDRNSAWRFTCEIQFYVAHWQLRAGVGKSLVDRLLAALDPVYAPRNAVQFACAGNSIQYEQGGERVVSKIVLGIPFAVKEDSDVKWQKEWLAQFGFEEMAIFPKVGRKLGKEISVMWLHKETGSILSDGM